MMMLGTCLSSFLFIMCASFFGMPISGTHTVIGALIGAGIAGVTAANINWKKTGWTVASWFISPILSSFIAVLLFILIAAASLGGYFENVSIRLTSVCLISAFCLTFIVYEVMWLALKDPDIMLIEILLPSTFVFGYL
jgi:phosphate/sulfate permease